MGMLMEKYRLSRKQLVEAMKQIFRERDTRARQIAADVKAGMQLQELMSTYRLTKQGLQKILNMLVEERYLAAKFALTLNSALEADSVVLGLVASPETDSMVPNQVTGGQLGSGGDSMTLDLRSSPRVRPPIPIRVQSQSNGSIICLLRDISENGLGLVGSRSAPNERRLLHVLGDEWGEVEPFEFEAQCRWARGGGSDQAATAGFNITQIAEPDLRLLQSAL